MIPVGIDGLGFYTSHYFIDLKTLAIARNTDPEKFYRGLGQYKMSVMPPDESIVTLAANAAQRALTHCDKHNIDTLLFATESGIDQSKAAGIFVHELLKLPKNCRVVELKQACYSGTAGLQMAMAMLQQNPKRSILLICADIARYGLGSVGESSQGGGAVAMLLSANPRILEIEPGSGVYTEDTMDFWRPNYRDEALVDGKYSCEVYLKSLKESWQHYQQQTGRHFTDHQQFLYHIPIPKLAEKAHQKLSLTCKQGRPSTEQLHAALHHSLQYSQMTGNCYSASLYLGLVSLLDHAREDLSGQRIGFYSYGSGCVAEYFSGKVIAGYQQQLHPDVHQQMLDQRIELDIAQYEAFYQHCYPQDGSQQRISEHSQGTFRLAEINEHKHIYRQREKSSNSLTARAPGKLIICGEHAVVYGYPAIAIAIDRFADTTISQRTPGSVLFNLLDLEHQADYTLGKLRQIKSRLKDSYQAFSRGEKSIRRVIEKPFELMQYTATNLIDKLNPKLNHGIKIDTKSNIPIGCGMGSSAATVVSTNYAIAQFFKQDLAMQKHYELALDAENLQHGQASGIDLHLAMQGGCIYFEHGQAQARQFPNFPLQIINTGKPQSTTGECVSAVTNRFKDPQLGQHFATVTQAIDHALKQQDFAAFQQGIKDNHRLLCELGVVPEKIQQLIQTLEQSGGAAAKICGAGSIAGEAGGIVLVVSAHDVSAIVQSFGLTIESVKQVNQGVALKA